MPRTTPSTKPTCATESSGPPPTNTTRLIRKKASETERDRAAGIKADVAIKDEYAAALALYGKAATDNDAKNYEASSAEFDSAATAFAQVYSHAKVKMDTAKSASTVRLGAVERQRGRGRNQ